MSATIVIALQGAAGEAQTFEFEEDSKVVLGAVAVLTFDVTTPGISPSDNDLYTVEMKPEEGWCSVIVKPNSPLHASGIAGFVAALRQAVAN